MSISFNQKTQQFRLTTQNTLYVFELAYGKLIHLYYGKKFGAVIPDFRTDYPKAIAFAPYREFEHREFGMTTLPQEYAYFGSGDYRTTALRIKNSDGIAYSAKTSITPAGFSKNSMLANKRMNGPIKYIPYVDIFPPSPPESQPSIFAKTIADNTLLTE